MEIGNPPSGSLHQGEVDGLVDGLMKFFVVLDVPNGHTVVHWIVNSQEEVEVSLS